MNVSLGHSKNLLSQNEAQSLLGYKYTILTMTDGIKGRNDNASPAYPFVNVTLDYQGKDIGLVITRTSARFDSLASTENEKLMARAVETLHASEPVMAAAKRTQVVASTVETARASLSDEYEVQAVNEDASLVAGHPVYESFIGFTSARKLQQASRQLSSQFNESRYQYDTITDRLRQAEGRRTASDNDNATGYQTSTYGVLVGLDGGYQSGAQSENYHLGLYGSKHFGELRLGAVGAYNWHRIYTSRSINYGAQSDRKKKQL